MFNINPKKMQAMMKQLGIKQEDIDAKKVIIEKEDSRIIIENPSVAKVVMQGQETFQISGDVREESEGETEQDREEAKQDIATIMEKTGCTEKEAEKALENNMGDLASAILDLSK